MDDERTLAGIELLEELDADQVEAVAQACRWRSVKAGEHILDGKGGGDGNGLSAGGNGANDHVFFLVQGTARVTNYSFSGREVTLDDLSAGSCFGEVGALGGTQRPGVVVALGDCLVASIQGSRFRSLLDEMPALSHATFAHLAEQIRAADERVTDLASLSAIDRVYAELLRLARPGDDDALTIQPVPMYSDIASRVGTVRETVSRVIGELVRHDVVERRDDALVILDADRLRAAMGAEAPERRSGRDRRLGLDRRFGPDRRHASRQPTGDDERRGRNDRRHQTL